MWALSEQTLQVEFSGRQLCSVMMSMFGGRGRRGLVLSAHVLGAALGPWGQLPITVGPAALIDQEGPKVIFVQAAMLVQVLGANAELFAELFPPSHIRTGPGLQDDGSRGPGPPHRLPFL